MMDGQGVVLLVSRTRRNVFHRIPVLRPTGRVHARCYDIRTAIYDDGDCTLQRRETAPQRFDLASRLARVRRLSGCCCHPICRCNATGEGQYNHQNDGELGAAWAAPSDGPASKHARGGHSRCRRCP
ncbi:hypothetical protein FHR89_000403 [Cellulomonas uda]|nr:hypothetical protein [Cellulomonas uda]